MPSTGDKAIYPLMRRPGIQRDGTTLSVDAYIDGEWCRWKSGTPKKIGGFLEIANGLNGPIRQLFIVDNSPLSVVNAFSGYGIQCLLIDENGASGGVYDRTPVGFVAQDVYNWQVDYLYSGAGGASVIVAHPGQNLVSISSAVTTPIYYGVDHDVAVLADSGESFDGGCCVLQPFLFGYGTDGLIKNAAANSAIDWATGSANTANVCGTKVVKGMALRGGSSSPSGLFWSLDSLIRVSFVGGTTIWQYDTLSSSISIVSPNSVIEYDGMYFWIGLDRFLVYSGVIKEVPNTHNSEFFFTNLNLSQRQKVWATKIPRYGEIWWFFPKGEATECNWAIVYNVKENFWYDTPIKRSSGYFPRVVNFPTWTDSDGNTDVNNISTGDTTRDSYRVIKHEFGVDSTINGIPTAVPSYFETSNIGFASGGPNGQGAENPNLNTRITRVEPDFVQSGNMTVEVIGSQFPQGADLIDDRGPYEFGDTVTGYAGTVDMRVQRRLLRLKFDSNELGGDYWMGKPLIHLEAGDERP